MRSFVGEHQVVLRSMFLDQDPQRLLVNQFGCDLADNLCGSSVRKNGKHPSFYLNVKSLLVLCFDQMSGVVFDWPKDWPKGVS